MILKQIGSLTSAVGHPAGSSLRSITNSMKGWVGEVWTAAPIDRKFHDHPHMHVLHDVRLSLGGRSCQIDHLIITPRRIVVLETKNYEGIVIRDGQDRWAIVSYEMNVTHIRSPSDQVRRAAGILDGILERVGIRVAVTPTIAFGPLSMLKLSPARGAPPVIAHSHIDDWLRDLVAEDASIEIIDEIVLRDILKALRL